MANWFADTRAGVADKNKLDDFEKQKAKDDEKIFEEEKKAVARRLEIARNYSPNKVEGGGIVNNVLGFLTFAVVMFAAIVITANLSTYITTPDLSLSAITIVNNVSDNFTSSLLSFLPFLV